MPAFRFTPDAPMLVLAPHLRYPTHNGADILIDRLARHTSVHLPYVDLLAEHEVVRFEAGKETQRTPFDNTMRGKPLTALRTLWHRSHFFLEKFNTPAFTEQAHAYLQDPAYRTVLCSYLTTTALLGSPENRPADRLHLVETHNDEFKWFQDLGRTTPNPLGKLVARQSARWLHRFFAPADANHVLLHVTEADEAGFRRYAPRHIALVVPIGVDVDGPVPPPVAPPVTPIRLMFVGSLGVRMNFDALAHFAERYFPDLKAHFGEALAVRVVGSRPSTAVRALCRAHGWSLHRDVSDTELRQLFAEATFAMLPFAYATGAKLKLLGALAHGVPFLATAHVAAQAEAAVYPSLLADDPAAWVARIEAVRDHGLRAEDRTALRAVAERHSWQVSADRLYEALLPFAR